jgi:tetratricopeptide (TPR) repeat protein
MVPRCDDATIAEFRLVRIAIGRHDSRQVEGIIPPERTPVMIGHARIRPVAVAMLAGISAGTAASASESPDVPKLKFGITLTAKPTKNHLRDAVQKRPDFTLMDGNRAITPSRVGLIYRIERTDRDKILLSMPSQGLYGWAARDAVIPYNEAEGYFTTELETRPPTAFAYLMRGVVCRDNDRFERTFRDLEAALRLNPGFVPAYIERSILWATRNRLDLAFEDVNRAVWADPSSPDAYLERGVYHYRLKEHHDALADLDHASNLGSQSIYIPLVRGSIYVERKQVDDAIKAFQEAIAIDPKSFDAHLMLGSSQLLRSQAAAAIQSFSRAIKLEPEMGGGYGGRAVAYMSLGQRKAALEDLNQAIRFDPMRADLFRDRGQVYAMEGQWSQALADMDTAVRLDPIDVEALVSRAWTLATCSDAKLRDGSKAVESATRACELTQWKSPRPLATLAAAFAEKGDFGGAVQMQRKALEVTPEKDPVRDYYLACLDRYRAKKPWHRVSVLEEWGLRRYHPTAKGNANGADAAGPRPGSAAIRAN